MVISPLLYNKIRLPMLQQIWKDLYQIIPNTVPSHHAKEPIYCLMETWGRFVNAGAWVNPSRKEVGPWLILLLLLFQMWVFVGGPWRNQAKHWWLSSVRIFINRRNIGRLCWGFNVDAWSWLIMVSTKWTRRWTGTSGTISQSLVNYTGILWSITWQKAMSTTGLLMLLSFSHLISVSTDVCCVM